jgi:hypothetical protein
VKKKIATAMLTLATVCGFAQQADTQPLFVTERLPAKVEVTLVPAEKVRPKDSFFYVRADIAPVETVGAMPGFGLGYRLISDFSALDISFAGKHRENDLSEGSTWTFPKVNYLYYLTPKADTSLYVGGGLALGGIEAKTFAKENQWETIERHSFKGILANATLGYELQRVESIRSFVQLDITQPTIASRQDGKFPGPWAEFSVGAGF